MRIAALVLALIGVLFTVLPLIQSPFWWVRIFDFIRLQVTVLCMIALGLTLYYKPAYWRWLVALLAFAFVHQADFITDYTPLKPVQARSVANTPSAKRFRLLVCNVRMENRQADALIELVRQTKPDLVLVNEPDNWWAGRLQPLHRSFPYRLIHPRSNTYGMILFSKFQLVQPVVRFLVEPDVPSLWTKVRLPSNDLFDLYCLHPRPPKPGTRSYERDAELLVVGRHIRRRGQPAIVAGDMNDVGWSRTSRLFQRYSGLLDPRRGRGLYNTYSTYIPLFRYPLDHIFYSNEFGLVGLERLPNIGSDHFPILVDLLFAPHRTNARHPPDRREGDRQRVNQKIRSGRQQ